MTWGCAKNILPRWVHVVVRLLAWLDHHVAEPLDMFCGRRWDLMDKHCRCPACQVRRGEKI